MRTMKWWKKGYLNRQMINQMIVKIVVKMTRITPLPR